VRPHLSTFYRVIFHWRPRCTDLPFQGCHYSLSTTTHQQDGHPQDCRELTPLSPPLIWCSARYRGIPGKSKPPSTPTISTIYNIPIPQSFVNTKICYRALPMREFIALNKRIFPVYFGCQVGLAALTAATRPPYSILSLANDLWSAVPLGVVLVMGSLNWFVYGPRTTTASLVRRALHGIVSPLGFGQSRLTSVQIIRRI